MIRIRSKRHNFRRCGVPHPKQPVEYSDDRFSKKELEILQAETMLIVERIPEEVEPDTETEPESESEEVAEPEEVIIKYQADEEEIVIAAKSAIALGKVTKDGKPLVEAIEEILGTDITAAERDEAWEKISRQ